METIFEGNADIYLQGRDAIIQREEGVPIYLVGGDRDLIIEDKRGFSEWTIENYNSKSFVMVQYDSNNDRMIAKLSKIRDGFDTDKTFYHGVIWDNRFPVLNVEWEVFHSMDEDNISDPHDKDKDPICFAVLF